MGQWIVMFILVSIDSQRIFQRSQALQSPGYIGCIPSSTLNLVDIEVTYFNSGKLCSGVCALYGYRYAATEGHYCKCAMEIRFSVYEDDTGCYFPCPGMLTEDCGGPHRVSLYDTWHVKATTETPNPTEPKTSPVIDLTPSTHSSPSTPSLPSTPSPPSPQPAEDDFTDEYTKHSFSVFTFTDASNTVSIKTDINYTTNASSLARPTTSIETNLMRFMEANVSNESTENNSLEFLSTQASQMVLNHPVCVKDIDNLMEPFADGTKADVKIQNDNSATQCTAHCKELQYIFSGTKSYLCICVNVISHTLDVNTKCETQCPGDNEETCGGEMGVLIRETGFTKSNVATGFQMSHVYIWLPVGIIVAGSAVLIGCLILRRWKSETGVKQHAVLSRDFKLGLEENTAPEDDHYQTIDPVQYVEHLTRTVTTADDNSDAGYLTPVDLTDTVRHITRKDSNATVWYITPMDSLDNKENYYVEIDA